MLAKILSGAIQGVDGFIVQVEVDLAQGLPSFSTVGLPEGAVRESKDRVKSAIKNSGYDFPSRRITVNLAPASIKKDGAGYDLPIALGIISASGLFNGADSEKVCVCGELSLDGEVRPVKGILPMVLAAKKEGVRRFVVPSANGHEAGVVSGIDIIGVDRLDQAVDLFCNVNQIEPVRTDLEKILRNHGEYQVDFAEVKGQEYAKRALEVAAAGGHNILMSGVPGTGKTMMARRLPTILPELSIEEALETTKVYSCTGLLPNDQPLMIIRPFRSPHHTISDAGLIGGGQIPKPGEVSLAHNGVLFLDELPEFRKNVLEVMRQPMEDGVVVISRAASSLTFPARFMLVAAMNPCPCGFLGDRKKECSCSPTQVQRYQSRLSGPLLDRIDIHVEVPPVPVEEIKNAKPGQTSATIQQRVQAARKVQSERFVKDSMCFANAQMSPSQLEKYCTLDTESANLMHASIEQFGLSARAYNRILKIARTIADLDGSENIQVSHLTEAIQYRRPQSANL